MIFKVRMTTTKGLTSLPELSNTTIPFESYTVINAWDVTSFGVPEKLLGKPDHITDMDGLSYYDIYVEANTKPQ